MTISQVIFLTNSTSNLLLLTYHLPFHEVFDSQNLLNFHHLLFFLPTDMFLCISNNRIISCIHKSNCICLSISITCCLFISKWISKKPHSNITDLQLQQIYSGEVVGKGVCITRMGTGRNYS